MAECDHKDFGFCLLVFNQACKPKTGKCQQAKWTVGQFTIVSCSSAPCVCEAAIDRKKWSQKELQTGRQKVRQTDWHTKHCAVWQDSVNALTTCFYDSYTKHIQKQRTGDDAVYKVRLQSIWMDGFWIFYRICITMHICFQCVPGKQ